VLFNRDQWEAERGFLELAAQGGIESSRRHPAMFMKFMSKICRGQRVDEDAVADPANPRRNRLKLHAGSGLSLVVDEALTVTKKSVEGVRVMTNEQRMSGVRPAWGASDGMSITELRIGADKPPVALILEMDTWSDPAPKPPHTTSPSQTRRRQRTAA